MARYAIALKDYDEHGNSATAYWYTRAGDTDNYSYDVADATTFSVKGAARCLMRALNLDEDEHFVEEV